VDISAVKKWHEPAALGLKGRGPRGVVVSYLDGSVCFTGSCEIFGCGYCAAISEWHRLEVLTAGSTPKSTPTTVAELDSAPMNGQPSDLRALFFGDSLVAGVRDPGGKGWVARVVAASFAEGLPLTAYNLGVRGETSQQVAARWRAESLPRLLPSTDARIVLSFGANDTTVEGGGLRVETE
jgi:hypothetical protein